MHLFEWRPTPYNAKQRLSYRTKTTISHPTFTEGAFPEQGIAKGKIELDALIFLEISDGSLVFPSAEEKVSVLRGISIMINAFLEYEAEALLNNYHYDVRKVQKADGQLTVNITAIPKGYKSKEMEIVGTYKTKLNHESAPFRLHSFVEPSGHLSKNYSLNWDILTSGTIQFR